MGTGQYVGFAAGATDDEVRQICLTAYGWKTVRIERLAGIVLARPMELRLRDHTLLAREGGVQV